MKFRPGYHKPFASMQTQAQKQFVHGELNDGIKSGWISRGPSECFLQDVPATDASKVVVARLQLPETT